MPAFEGLVARYPSSFEVQVEYARRAASDGSSAIAIRTLERLSDFDPASRPIARQLASLCLFVGQLQRAQAPIKHLLSTNPSAKDWILSARLEHSRGDLVSAELSAHNALVLDASSSTAHHILASVLLDKDDTNESTARAELELALALDPGLGKAHYALGTLLMQMGEEVAGKRSLNKSMLVQELTGPVFARLPVAKRIQRAYKIGRSMPKWSLPAIEIARSELERNRLKKAESSLKRAARLTPDSTERYRLLFVTAEAMGEEKLAKKRLVAWRKARAHM